MVLVDKAGIAKITQINEFQMGKDGQIHATSCYWHFWTFASLLKGTVVPLVFPCHQVCEQCSITLNRNAGGLRVAVCSIQLLEALHYLLLIEPL